MKLHIKVIHRELYFIDVNETTSILDIKKKIEYDLRIPVKLQTLIHMGKSLSDERMIGFYPKIKDGDKLYLIIKKIDSLELVLERKLRMHYSDSDTKKIVEQFMKEFQLGIETSSYEDLERLALICRKHNSNLC